MRDGIWKSLDLPIAWRRVARLCQHEARRGETASRAALKALGVNLKRQLSTTFLADFRRRSNEPSLLDVCDPSADPPSAADTLEQRAWTALVHLNQAGAKGSLPQEALEIAIREHLENINRQCEEQYARDPDPAAMETAKAFADAVWSICIPDIAAALIDGASLKSQPVLSAIDVENDDLSRPQ